MSVKIPAPITFNPHKHHFHFLLSEIERWKHMNWELVEQELLTIGTNLIDFYLGNLDVQQICNETITFFEQTDLLDKEIFKYWLDAPNYKKIRLSDSSEWLIKEGNNHERYIHIHPAKFSAHTIRVRATTLKTVIALTVHSIQIKKGLKTNLQAVNRIRRNRLGLSPIKSLHPGTGILRLWELFEEESSNVQ
ncbi:MAG: hypothetical protein ABFS16_05300 [Bacteroidota bacterium]